MRQNLNNMPRCVVCGAAITKAVTLTGQVRFCDRTCRDAYHTGRTRGEEMEHETATEDLTLEAEAARAQFKHLDYLAEEEP